MVIAVSAAGVYRTEDRGRTWHVSNKGIRAEFMPDKYPEFGQCVHKVVHHDARPERLFLQNHGGLYRSDDWGDRWQDIADGVPSDFGFAMAMHPTDPDTVYILPLDGFGRWPVDAKLQVYRTRDGGASWKPVEGYLKHPHRDFWSPGNGGLCLHTILLDPARSSRMLAAQSTGGVYRTEDGGRSWNPRNQGVRADFLPDKYPEFGQCVHKIVQSKPRPDRMYLQNHWGLYRSDDRGETWTDIANGVPSDFGFGLTIHPRDPECAWIVPLESDEFRCTPEGKLRVYRTRDAGASWQPLTDGLPQEGAYEAVLRDALASDPLDRVGVYFGTRNGKVFASADEGDHWTEVLDGLPPVVSVKAVIV
jgi:photosystem II stability/assembly factor-like uncharacterized protein